MAAHVWVVFAFVKTQEKVPAGLKVAVPQSLTALEFARVIVLVSAQALVHVCQ